MTLFKLILMLSIFIAAEVGNEHFWFKYCSKTCSIWIQCLGSFFTSIFLLTLFSIAVNLL